ncbi:MAG: sulfite exporter TauE/SafE family protein [Gammaproteobacteria bacterium]|nr:sulfite exporter TauE/SafE family protein [Gammaproteobacteria bacterium]
MLEIAVIYVLVGTAAGTIAGLLGIGGGFIIVPALLFVFHNQGFAPDLAAHMAIGTSLATIVPTSLSSLLAHHRRGAVQWPVFRLLAPGIILGALAGSMVAGMLHGRVLHAVFGLFASIAAVQLILNRPPAPHRQLPHRLGMIGAGSFIGAVSGITGIGGGSLTVPFLLWCNVGVRQAVATSAACGFPIAVSGTLGFVASGWHDSGLPAWSTGSVYWPAVLVIAAASVTFAQLGARLAHRLPVKLLKRIFAGFLVFMSIKLLAG